VRALGYYWMLRGQPGEPEALARDVLELQPRERSPRIAEARMVGALVAAGPSWEIHAVHPVLSAAVADFAELAGDQLPSNPVAAMAEPMLALSDRNPERAVALFDRYLTSPEPFVRAAMPMMRGSFSRMLGRIDSAESDFRESLVAFRALGEAWGAASVLIQLAELVADTAPASASVVTSAPATASSRVAASARRPGSAGATSRSAVVLPNGLTSPVASTACADFASYRMSPSWPMPLSERAHPPVSPSAF
jgi:hypothetical protein